MKKVWIIRPGKPRDGSVVDMSSGWKLLGWVNLGKIMRDKETVAFGLISSKIEMFLPKDLIAVAPCKSSSLELT